MKKGTSSDRISLTPTAGVRVRGVCELEFLREELSEPEKTCSIEAPTRHGASLKRGKRNSDVFVFVRRTTSVVHLKRYHSIRLKHIQPCR